MSIASMQRDRHAALATLFKAFRIHQTRSFKYDADGPNMAGLRLCERFGWVWFERGRAAITSEGLRELEPYRRSEPKPLVQHICPVCLDVCSQEDAGDGLPEPPYCPSCRDLTRQQIEVLLTEQQQKQRGAA